MLALPKDFIREDLYYTSEELKIQKFVDIKAKFESELNNEQVDVNFVTFRGLEEVCNKDQRRQRIKQHVKGVLEVQTEQREAGCVDSYEIFIVARAQSKNDRKAAHRIAVLDAQAAAAVLSEACPTSDDEISLASTSVSSCSHETSQVVSSSRAVSSWRGKKTIRRCVSGAIKVISTSSKGLLLTPSTRRELLRLQIRRSLTM